MQIDFTIVKLKPYFMKALTLFSLLIASTFFFGSCSKDTDPADVDVFAGTFRGSISYSDSESNKSTETGSVFVTKVGNNYNFRFSDGIPDLTGVEFERKDDNTMVSLGSSGTGVITITKDRLVIGFTRSGRTWGADCDR